MFLKEYITYFIKEAISYSKLNLIIRELNNITINYKAGDKYYSKYGDIIKAVDKFGLIKIDAGIYRKTYAMPGEDWVLKFAYGHNEVDYLDALETIKHEVDISQGMHGTGSRDIFVQVYYWDKISDKPTWIITEKAVTLSKASQDSEESISIESLSNIFPTFWNSLYNNSIEKNSKNFFCNFVVDTLNEITTNTNSGKKISGLSKEDFYLAMKEAAIIEENIKPFELINFNFDFTRISKACAYSIPSDVASGNIGIIPSDSPSPKDIVILDYSIDY